MSMILSRLSPLGAFASSLEFIAHPTVTLAIEQIGIWFVKWMTFCAMCFCFIVLRSWILCDVSNFSSAYVLRLRDWLQVLRIYAAWRATQMIEYMSIRDRTDDKHISDAMSTAGFPVNMNLGVTLDIQATCPEPTSSFQVKLHVLHQSLMNWISPSLIGRRKRYVFEQRGMPPLTHWLAILSWFRWFASLRLPRVINQITSMRASFAVALSCLRQVSVVSTIWMSARTVRFCTREDSPRILQRIAYFTPPRVFGRRDRLKMFWIHACAISAQMVDVITRRYRSFVDFITNSVNTEQLPIPSDLSVTISADVSSPDPASRFGTNGLGVQAFFHGLPMTHRGDYRLRLCSPPAASVLVL